MSKFLKENCLCLCEIFFLILSLIIFESQNQKGVKYSRLMNILGDVNISNNINFFLVISSFTILCLLAVIILKNFRSRLINPLRELVVNCVLTLILTMASILFCVALSQITTKQLVKDVGLTFGYYDVSMGLSFMCSVLLFGSCWYSFKCFKNKRHNEMPLNVSHSNTDLPNDIPT